MHNLHRLPTLLIASIAVMAGSVPAMARPGTGASKAAKGMAVAYPWVFEHGHATARLTAVTSAEEIVRKAEFASVPGEVARAKWTSLRLPVPSFGHLPTKASLRLYGRSLNVAKVVYGSVSWHTRSIWVNAGPKTISTATVNAYVFDVATGKTEHRLIGIRGRSDEKSNGYKIAADILFTPLVTAVSGGPATPREQRAVQIALGLAYHTWVEHSVATN